MTNKDIILKSVKYIEKNLKSEIQVMDVANEVCYSLYHFIRLFQSVTGYSPKHYIQQRRLSLAAYELRDTDKKIADIAYDFQFGSPESFTRAFQRQFQVNPGKIRKGHSLGTLPLIPAITSDYIYQSDKAREVPPKIIELPERTLVGIAFFIADDAKITSLGREWGQFMAEVPSVKYKKQPETFYQVQYWSMNQDLGGLYFFIGVEVDKIEGLAPHFVIKVIPHGKYLKFIHKGLANKVGYTYKYIYNQYLPETDYRLTQPFNFELYGEKCLGPDNENSESEIYIPID